MDFLESSIEFYTSLVEQLQLTEGSLGDSQSRRKVRYLLLIVNVDMLTSVIV